MKNIFIGVDPGKQGFITVYDPNKDQYDFYPMPEEKIETGGFSKTGKPEIKSEFSPMALKNLAIEIDDKYNHSGKYRFHAIIEDVVGRQGWSAQNNFSFGNTAGIQLMFLMQLNAEVTFVRPQKWQSMMYQGHEKIMVASSTGKTKVHDTKATSAKVAQSLAPDIDFRKTTRSKNIDDNKTDSFLMCIYGYKQFLKNNK